MIPPPNESRPEIQGYFRVDPGLRQGYRKILGVLRTQRSL